MDEVATLTSLIDFPPTFELVSRTLAQRNGQQVSILRFQPFGQFQENGPRIIGIFNQTQLLSFKQMIQAPADGNLTAAQAQARAAEIFQATNPDYAKGLSFIRVESQRRQLLDADGETIFFPVYWVKFGHRNGSYNWVTLAMDGTLIEMEIGAQWDYFRGRRATEM